MNKQYLEDIRWRVTNPNIRSTPPVLEGLYEDRAALLAEVDRLTKALDDLQRILLDGQGHALK